jgi:hypothetical protein
MPLKCVTLSCFCVLQSWSWLVWSGLGLKRSVLGPGWSGLGLANKVLLTSLRQSGIGLESHDLGLESPGPDLGLEGPGLGLRILAFTTSLLIIIDHFHATVVLQLSSEQRTLLAS